MKKSDYFLITLGMILLGVLCYLIYVNWSSIASDSSNQNQSEVFETEIVPEKVRYEVTYTVWWGRENHEGEFPPNAHTSPIVVASYNKPGTLFKVGQKASPGIEEMAETGKTDILAGELNKSLASNNVFSYKIGEDTDAPGEQILEIEVDRSKPYVSAVTMLAPSPDWFLGSEDIKLFDKGEWIRNTGRTMDPYDAGTDSGVGFSSPDSDTQPKQKIAKPRDKVFQDASLGRFASINFSLIDE